MHNLIISDNKEMYEKEADSSAIDVSTRTVSSSSRETSSISTMTSIMSEEKTTTSYKLSQQWSWWNPGNHDIDPVTYHFDQMSSISLRIFPKNNSLDTSIS